MIAAVKGWPAVFTALLFFLPTAATAAQDLSGAARELARKTAAFAGRGDTVSVTCRNAASERPGALGELRSAFEAALQEAGLRLGDAGGAVEARLTLSEDQSQYLLVEEARKGDERQVWIASWKREAAANRSPARLTLDKRRVWEQDEQILDAAFTESSMLVLAPSAVTVYTRPADSNALWEPRQSAPLTPLKPWPRDLRGRLRITGVNFQVFLPGMVCNGAVDSVPSMQCHASDEPWLLESGSRGILLANFAAARNYFDGHVVTQTGQRKTVAPFYSAAEVEDQGRTFWLLAALDGRTQIVDSSFESVGTIPGWGSDIAGVDARCGSGSQVMATRATDASEPDAVQVFAVANRAAAPMAEPVAFAGPVTALWPAGATSVLAVERDSTAGKYAAYLLTVSCGN
jgi:hypothetical protein